MTNVEEMEKNQQIQNEIANLKLELSSQASPIGDWKGIKYNEFAAMKKPAPYTEEEMQDYYQKRQAVRDKINTLQEQLKA